MQRLEEFVSAGGKLLRCGYTTGTCAAAAAQAATMLLLAGACPPTVEVDTPSGIRVLLDIEHAKKGDGWARCAVRKDAGDDPDVTDGVMVYAKVAYGVGAAIGIDGGVGVGRVTKPGLDQPVGAAAINSVPRAMIADAVRVAMRAQGFEGGIEVEISIPEGTRIAERTFNPKLGIEGGISVLGTTGIVRPMSEDALMAAIGVELSVLVAAGATHALVVPGNYGKRFAHEELGLDVRDAIVCSNYLGATIDEAARLGFATMLVVGHLGKMVKVAGGIMNTHSRVADCRAEVFAAHAALAGASQDVIRALMGAPTTDAMVKIVREAELLEQTMASLMGRLEQALAQRAGETLHVEAVVFSNTDGVLGMTTGAAALVGDSLENGGVS